MTGSRALILTGIGVLGLLVFVFPMYDNANQPRPPLQVSGDVLGVTVDSESIPAVWVNLKAREPKEGSNSELQTILSFDGSASESTIAGSVILQGRLAEANATCDLGTLQEVTFNNFSESEKKLTYHLIRDITNDSSAPELVLAQQAATMQFTRISFSKDFSASDAGADRNIFINCLLTSTAVWNHAAGPSWDVELPTIGVIGASQTDETTGQNEPRSYLSSTLAVERGDQLFYQEGYPAPSASDQESDSFTKTSNSRISSGDYTLLTAEAMNARYSDTIAESQGNSSVFFAGVLAGLFASFIGAALLSVIDEAFGFRVLADFGTKEPPPTKSPSRLQKILTRARRGLSGSRLRRTNVSRRR